MLLNARKDIAQYGRKLHETGLIAGTGGNLSVRDSRSGRIAISPSGMEHDAIRAADVPVLAADGRLLCGTRRPSSELPMHLHVYRGRPDINALVHTHSRYATALSCLRKALPAVHYALGFAGPAVRCAPYATYGSRTLADHALRCMAGRKAVLLANHGVLAGGATLAEAFAVAQMVEFCAEVYCLAKAVGNPIPLPAREMRRVIEKLADYGQQPLSARRR